MATGSETMTSGDGKSTEIAMNVARTWVTVLGFNLTIIALMLSIMASQGKIIEHDVREHLTSFTSLFVGFCLTILGLFWLLSSLNLDAKGMSRPWLFALGSITAYLALSQTVTAFMHEYLLGVASVAEVLRPAAAEGVQSLRRDDAFNDAALVLLFVMGGAIWALVNYVGPLIVGLKCPVSNGWRWGFAGYYLALQVPIYCIYARAYELQYELSDQPASTLSLFALQFFQPLLWFR